MHCVCVCGGGGGGGGWGGGRELGSIIEIGMIRTFSQLHKNVE